MNTKTIPVGQDILSPAKQAAADLRADFTRRGIFIVNIVSSPGAGKTSLLEATARHWGGQHKMSVLVGDLATDRDAQRLSPLAPTVQLTTGGACHLEMPLIKKGLEQLGPIETEFLFIENIGNLVCPASHDLGEHLRVVVLSTTEGDDKPGKYPKMFRTSQVLVITKTDLLPYVPFSVDSAVADAQLIQPDIQSIAVCARSGEGIAEWCEMLEAARDRMVASRDDHAAVH
ncbi:MAG: hypB [Planctomycetaceae bacterium]|nr:hypB [Planctomycetaceae bacterium]